MSDTPSIPQRTCTKCGETFPATLEYFHYQKRGKYSLSSWCIVCHRERNKQNAAKMRENPEYREAQREYDKARYTVMRDYYIAHNHKYYAENREKEIERTHVKYIKNSERYKAKRREYGKTPAGRAQSKKDGKLFRLRHPEKAKARAKKGKSKRRAMMANAEGHHTKADLLQMYEDQSGRCAYCGINIFWEIPNDIHADHIEPLSRGGTNWPSNICLTCADCNHHKNDKTVAEWQAVRGW